MNEHEVVDEGQWFLDQHGPSCAAYGRGSLRGGGGTGSQGPGQAQCRIPVRLGEVHVAAAHRETVWLAFPLGALFACIVAGFALAVAALNALYRDIEHLLQALLLPWFFLTPILYSLDQLPGVDEYPAAEFALHWVNFLTPPIEAMRAVLFYGDAPGAADTLYTVVAAVVALTVGAYVFSRSDDRIATEV